MSDGDRALRLRLHGEPVAILVERGGGQRRVYELVFDPSWVGQLQRPVLSLGAVNWRLPTPRRFNDRPPPFITNLLPERGGALRRRIAREASIDEKDDMALLRFVGRDMSGAITAEDVEAPAPATRVVEDASEYTAAAERLRWSLGGMQLKFSVDRTDRLTLFVRGRRGRWILKVPDVGRLNLARAEYAAMEWARRVGFEVPLLEIVDPREVDGLPQDAVENVPEALLIRRFDRTDEHAPIHMEEVASVIGVHPEEKYSEPHDSQPANHLVRVGRLVRRFAGEAGLELFLKRVVFDVMVGNGDAHLKNWAFLLHDRRTPSLAPAYDIVPTILYGYKPELALRFAGGQSFRSIDRDKVQLFAVKVGASPEQFARLVRETVDVAASTFDDAMSAAGMSEPRIAGLRAHWESLPLVRGK